MAQYVALLRGINVGGKNVIPMAELRRCLEELGLGDVATYIQSGNLLFGAADGEPADLAARIEVALMRRFGYDARIALRSLEQIRAIVAGAPAGFGGEPDRYRYDVAYLREPATAAEVMASLKLRKGVDEAFAGVGACYFSRLIARATQSQLGRIIQLPIYQSITIRNWNTTTRLLALMDARGTA